MSTARFSRLYPETWLQAVPAFSLVRNYSSFYGLEDSSDALVYVQLKQLARVELIINDERRKFDF